MANQKFADIKFFRTLKEAKKFAKEKKADGYKVEIGKGGLKIGMSEEYGVTYS